MRIPVPRSLGRSVLALATGAALVTGAVVTAGPAAAVPGNGNGGGVGNAAPTLVQTDEGKLRGTRLDGYRTFEGIRYAEAPVGDLRFRPPVPVAPFRGIADATAPHEPCAQLANGTTNAFQTSNEDCLFLNVTTPAGLDAARSDLPVMVWIHGGSWVYGNGANYDAAKLAVEGDAVVVTINYRLGPMGFMAQRDLSAANGPVGSGSAGLLDQQEALRWVQRNIDAFGGDPDNVTVFGESAGASSVCAQLASPTAAGLFDKAIAQSYSCTTPYDTLDTEEATGQGVATAVGCAGAADVAACLRAVPAEALLRAWPGGSFVVGGSSLPEQPGAAIAAGRWNRVPVVHGNLQDENTLFTPLSLPEAQRQALLSADPAVYTATLQQRFGTRAAAVAERYPLAEHGSTLRVLAAVASDVGSALSTCTHVGAYDLLRGQQPAVFAYSFRDQDAPALLDFPYDPARYDEGAQHAGELPYLFPGLFGGPLTAEQQALSTTMVRYWTNFAATGDPNGRGVPAWNAYRTPADVQGLDVAAQGGVGPVDVAADANCAFWAAR
ncbi:carboxylesterase/lipase family protein [Geodermatophilus sp. SYSU D01036]